MYYYFRKVDSVGTNGDFSVRDYNGSSFDESYSTASPYHRSSSPFSQRKGSHPALSYHSTNSSIVSDNNSEFLPPLVSLPLAPGSTIETSPRSPLNYSSGKPPGTPDKKRGKGGKTGGGSQPQPPRLDKGLPQPSEKYKSYVKQPHPHTVSRLTPTSERKKIVHARAHSYDEWQSSPFRKSRDDLYYPSHSGVAVVHHNVRAPHETTNPYPKGIMNPSYLSAAAFGLQRPTQLTSDVNEMAKYYNSCQTLEIGSESELPSVSPYHQYPQSSSPYPHSVNVNNSPPVNNTPMSTTPSPFHCGVVRMPIAFAGHNKQSPGQFSQAGGIMGDLRPQRPLTLDINSRNHPLGSRGSPHTGNTPTQQSTPGESGISTGGSSYLSKYSPFSLPSVPSEDHSVYVNQPLPPNNFNPFLAAPLETNFNGLSSDATTMPPAPANRYKNPSGKQTSRRCPTVEELDVREVSHNSQC